MYENHIKPFSPCGRNAGYCLIPKQVVRTVTEGYAVEGKKLLCAIRNGGRLHLPMIVGMRKRKLSQLKLESYEEKLSIYTYPQHCSVGEVAAMSRRAFYTDILLLRCVINTHYTHSEKLHKYRKRMAIFNCGELRESRRIIVVEIL